MSGVRPTYAGLTSGLVNVPPGGTALVTVTNHTVPVFGNVSVTKRLTGATEGVIAGTTFPITVACDAPAKGEVGDYSETFDLAVNDTDTTPEPAGRNRLHGHRGHAAPSMAWSTTRMRGALTRGPERHRRSREPDRRRHGDQQRGPRLRLTGHHQDSHTPQRRRRRHHRRSPAPGAARRRRDQERHLVAHRAPARPP